MTASEIGMRAALFLYLLLTLLAPGPAPAQDTLRQGMTADVERLTDNLQTYRRAAVAYLRTENADLAAIEIERLVENWNAAYRALSVTLAGDQALATAVAETGRLLSDSLAAVDQGNLSRARGLLEQAAVPLRTWRKSKGIRIFSDCIAEAGDAYERLDVHRRTAPDLGVESVSKAIVDAAKSAETAYLACDREAPHRLRAEPEFRRLMDGMIGSLGQIPDAVGKRDAAYLHRLLIEQRAYERLLTFRHG